jgi:PAS domain S-box-containing protein
VLVTARIGEEDLRDLFEDAPCGFLVTLTDARIVLANRTLEQWTGRSRDELLASRFHDLVTVPGRIFYENQYAPLLHMQGSVKEVAFDLVRPGRSPLPILMNSSLRSHRDGRPPLIVSTIFDATDRRLYEGELLQARRRAEQLAAVVTVSSDAIMLMAPDGTLRTWNPGATRLFGQTADAAIGRPVGAFLRTLAVAEERERVMGDLRAGRTVHLEGDAEREDGDSVPVSIALAPHTGPLGELEAVSLIVRDISARRAAERLQHEFLAMVGHELRNPIAAISGHAQLLLRRGAYSETAMRAIVRQAGLLERLIDDLLLASQIEANRLEVRPGPIDLVSELRAAIDLFQSEDRPIVLDAPSAPVSIVADQHRVAQIFNNLFSNATKYSPAGADVLVTVTVDAPLARVRIADRGVGIPAEALPHLFDRFFRARTAPKQGLGLGLYITRRLVEAHGGTIAVESEVGRGTAFTVSLPVSPRVTEPGTGPG